MKPEEYPWSSAATHCGLKNNPLLAGLPDSMNAILKENWSEWLTLPESQAVADVIQSHVKKGLPCGNDNFISGLEIVAKRALRYKAQGRPFKNNKG